MLMAAHAYYETSFEMVPDWLFDEWYEQLKHIRYRIKHPHLHLIDTRGNGSGGCTLGVQYPEMVKGALREWRNYHGL